MVYTKETKKTKNLGLRPGQVGGLKKAERRFSNRLKRNDLATL